MILEGSSQVRALAGLVSPDTGFRTWTFTLSTPLTATEAFGAVVSQTSNSATGTLSVALENSAVSSITVTAAAGQIFDTTVNLIVGSTPVLQATYFAAGSGVTSLINSEAYWMLSDSPMRVLKLNLETMISTISTALISTIICLF